MQILIDGRSITQQASGIGRYTYELIKGYVREYGKDSVKVIVNHRIKDFPYSYILCPFQRHSLIDNVRFSFFLKKLDYNIYHAGDLIGPFFKKKNVVHIITVHDLMLLKVKDFNQLPYLHDVARKIKFKGFWRSILRNADIIISVSDTTRKDINDIYGLDSIILREGINMLDCKSLSDSKFKFETGSYFLYVGLAMHHKNIQFLIDVFLKSNTDKKLVICGKGHVPIASDRIVYTGWVDDANLDYLYRNCAAFIFPSIYEGFGLPVLEALSYHCRVFSSNAASLCEFSGDVLSFFSPTDGERLRFLIEHCDNIPVNETLIDDYLQHFKWEEIWKEFHQYLRTYIYERR